MEKTEVEISYFYPLLIPPIPQKTFKPPVGLKLKEKDSVEKEIQHMIYFKHPYLCGENNIEALREGTVSFSLSKPIIRKNGECSKEFQATLLSDGGRWNFIGLDSSSAILWISLPIEIEYQGYDDLFGKLIILTLIGDLKCRGICRSGNKNISVLALANNYRREILDGLKRSLTIEEIYNDILEEKNPCDPYVIVILRQPFNENTIEKIINKMNSFISSQNLNIASLLIRSKGVSFADKSFISKYMVSERELLTNMCARTDFFINVHERASIVIHPLLKNNGNKENFFALKELKNTYKSYSNEFIRSVAYLIAQWFSYAVWDVWLTKKIVDYSKIIREYGNIETRKNKENKGNQAIKKLKELADIKKFVISVLHEVVTIKMHRGSLKGIIDNLSGCFNISQIKENLKFKLSQIDSLVSYLLEVVGRYEIESISPKARRLAENFKKTLKSVDDANKK